MSWAFVCFPLFVSFVCPPGGFLDSFVLPLGFSFIISLCLFKPIGSASMGGIAGGLGVTRGGFTAVHVVVDLLCCLVLSFIIVGHWIIGRAQNGSCWSLL